MFLVINYDDVKLPISLQKNDFTHKTGHVLMENVMFGFKFPVVSNTICQSNVYFLKVHTLSDTVLLQLGISTNSFLAMAIDVKKEPIFTAVFPRFP